MKSVSIPIKVTIIEESLNYDGMGRAVHHLNETTFYPKYMEELYHAPLGRRADRIRLEIEFGKDDVRKLVEMVKDDFQGKLLEFINNSYPCFIHGLKDQRV